MGEVLAELAGPQPRSPESSATGSRMVTWSARSVDWVERSCGSHRQRLKCFQRAERTTAERGRALSNGARDCRGRHRVRESETWAAQERKASWAEMVKLAQASFSLFLFYFLFFSYFVFFLF
jgi:hypothetical protein